MSVNHMQQTMIYAVGVLAFGALPCVSDIKREAFRNRGRCARITKSAFNEYATGSSVSRARRWWLLSPFLVEVFGSVKGTLEQGLRDVKAAGSMGTSLFLAQCRISLV